MTFANLPKLHVMVKWLPNEFVNAYFFNFMNKIVHILMYKCIHKPIYHAQTPKIPRAFTHKAVWKSSNHHIQVCQIGKTYGKSSIYVRLHSCHWSGVPKITWNSVVCMCAKNIATPRTWTVFVFWISNFSLWCNHVDLSLLL